jgi:GxxExxY protein
MNENEIGTAIVESALKVHRALGPGLLEAVYEAAMAHELRTRGFEVERQKPMTFSYEGVRFEEGYRADLVVDRKVIVEVKSVENRLPVHKKQLLTYLRLADVRLGYLVNFNEYLVKDGIERMVNGLPNSPSLSSSASSASLRETSSV